MLRLAKMLIRENLSKGFYLHVEYTHRKQPNNNNNRRPRIGEGAKTCLGRLTSQI